MLPYVHLKVAHLFYDRRPGYFSPSMELPRHFLQFITSIDLPHRPRDGTYHNGDQNN